MATRQKVAATAGHVRSRSGIFRSTQFLGNNRTIPVAIAKTINATPTIANFAVARSLYMRSSRSGTLKTIHQFAYMFPCRVVLYIQGRATTPAAAHVCAKCGRRDTRAAAKAKKTAARTQSTVSNADGWFSG